ncbi:MAG: SurA N-terminal domain-containing protein, partial [Eggerthellaceae bacterium]|nr:SurA N-terminal domain-containing protein [Eggerthellaceae bacterium]
MSKRIVLRAVLVASVAAACAFGVTACTGGTGSASSASGTAATVNSVEIPESEVTEYVEGIRNQYGLSDESAWGQFLASNNMTPETVREQMIDSFVERELVKAGAKERNLTVDSEEVDGYVTSMRNNYATDEAWENALSQAGFTEEEYRAQIESSLIQQQLRTELENEVTLSDEDILDAAKTYLPYFDGARRSSHILFDASDEEKAKDVLARIKDGSLDFADAAKEYSQDSSADNGGDVGWDVTSSFVSEYQTALSALGEGEVSDLVTSQYGIHIIKCTAVFTAPAEVTSLDQIPEEFLNSITEMAKSIKTSTN